MEYIGNIYLDKLILKTETPIVIYGAGKIGKIIFEILKNNNKDKNVCCFCDRKIKGNMYNQISVILPEKAVIQYPEACYIVSGSYAKEMMQFLWGNHIKRIHLVFV